MTRPILLLAPDGTVSHLLTGLACHNLRLPLSPAYRALVCLWVTADRFKIGHCEKRGERDACHVRRIRLPSRNLHELLYILPASACTQRIALHLLCERYLLLLQVSTVVPVSPGAAALCKRGDELLPRLHLAIIHPDTDVIVTENEGAERLPNLGHHIVRAREDVCVYNDGMRSEVIPNIADEEKGIAVVRLLITKGEYIALWGVLDTGGMRYDSPDAVFDEEERIRLVFLAHFPFAGRQHTSKKGIKPGFNIPAAQGKSRKPTERYLMQAPRRRLLASPGYREWVQFHAIWLQERTCGRNDNLKCVNLVSDITRRRLPGRKLPRYTGTCGQAEDDSCSRKLERETRCLVCVRKQ